MEKLKRFLNEIGIEPKNLAHYRRALTHLSAAENPSESYERLEFLGDSVTGVVISKLLFEQFPDKEEGDPSRIRAQIVSRESLGAKAVELHLDDYLRAKTVRIREGGVAEFSIMSDCFEAIVGAIFADRGYTQAKSFILRHLKTECIALKDMHGPCDAKSQLQELWQQRYKEPPEYVVVSEKGPDHNKIFSVHVLYKGKVLGKGKGSSKKRAEQDAAMAAVTHEMKKKDARRRNKKL
jgi:ribonuclease III